jgi:predicted transcriptional regulator
MSSPPKKVHVSARVDETIVERCNEIARKMNWSLSQLIEKAMDSVKLEDLVNEISTPKI